MIRIAIYYGLPFLLPFGAYALYVMATRRAEAKGIKWQDAPWVWLAIASLGCGIAGFVFMALTAGDDPIGTYVPPHIEDGRVVPGQVK